MQETTAIPKEQTLSLSREDKTLLIQTALYAGEILVKSGAEMYRVEETVVKMCESKGALAVTPFITPTVIFLSGEGEQSMLYTRNIKKRSSNITKIALVNDFSRQFTAGKIELSKAMPMLKEIDRHQGYPHWLVLIATGIGCGVFALLLDGAFGDFIAAFIASCFAVFFNTKISAHARTVFTGNFVASMFVGIVSVISFTTHLVASLDNIIVAAALALVPGVAFTAGIRDFISGDLISGMARIGESILVAVAIAFGTGSILMLYSLMGGF